MADGTFLLKNNLSIYLSIDNITTNGAEALCVGALGERGGALTCHYCAFYNTRTQELVRRRSLALC